MRSGRSFAWEVGQACLVALAAACSNHTDKVVEDPYEGTAFPDRREAFSLPEGDVGITSDNGSDSATLLDLKGFKVLASEPIGVDPVGLDGPHHVAVSRKLNAAFVALSYPAPPIAPGPHAAHGASQRPGLVERLTLENLAPNVTRSVETNPGDIVLSEDSARLVVTHFDLLRAARETELAKQRADLALLDPRAIDSTPLFIRTCVAPHGVALSRPNGAWAFVACYGEDALAVVNLDDPSAEVELVKIGHAGDPSRPAFGPYAAILSNDGSSVAVSNTESSDVRIFDVPARSFAEIVIVTPGKPYFTAWSETDQRLYIPTQNPDALIVVDPATARIKATRTFAKEECLLPHEVVFGSDPATLFVVCEGDHESSSLVLAVDADTLETKAVMPVGIYPDRLAIARGAE
jgi:DNA-binding beta-propeller fold protein YncE